MCGLYVLGFVHRHALLCDPEVLSYADVFFGIARRAWFNMQAMIRDMIESKTKVYLH